MIPRTTPLEEEKQENAPSDPIPKENSTELQLENQNLKDNNEKMEPKVILEKEEIKSKKEESEQKEDSKVVHIPEKKNVENIEEMIKSDKQKEEFGGLENVPISEPVKEEEEAKESLEEAPAVGKEENDDPESPKNKGTFKKDVHDLNDYLRILINRAVSGNQTSGSNLRKKREKRYDRKSENSGKKDYRGSEKRIKKKSFAPKFFRKTRNFRKIQNKIISSEHHQKAENSSKSRSEKSPNGRKKEDGRSSI